MHIFLKAIFIFNFFDLQYHSIQEISFHLIKIQHQHHYFFHFLNSCLDSMIRIRYLQQYKNGIFKNSILHFQNRVDFERIQILNFLTCYQIILLMSLKLFHLLGKCLTHKKLHWNLKILKAYKSYSFCQLLPLIIFIAFRNTISLKDLLKNFQICFIGPSMLCFAKMNQVKKNLYHHHLGFFFIFCFQNPFLRFSSFYFAFGWAKPYLNFVNKQDALAI